MARLQQHYREKVVPEMTTKFGYKSPMEVPRLTKITLNMGVSEAVADKKVMDHAVGDLTKIAGQKPVVTNGLLFADFETGDGLAGLGDDGFLTGNFGQVAYSVVHDFFVRHSFADTHVQGDFGQTRHFHGGFVAKLGGHLGDHFFTIVLLESCHVHAALMVVATTTSV